MTLLIDRPPRQYMAQPVADDLLYSGVTVELETQNEVQIRPSYRVQDSEFLCADDSAECRDSSDREQLRQCLGVLAIQHVIQDVEDGVVVLGLLVEHHGLLDELRVELWGDRAVLAEGPIDVGLDGASRHDGRAGLEVPFPEVDHSGRFPGSGASD